MRRKEGKEERNVCAMVNRWFVKVKQACECLHILNLNLNETSYTYCIYIAMCCSHQHTAYIICTHTCDYTLRNGQYGLHQRHIFLSVISKFRFVLFHFTYTRNSIQHTWAANGPTVKSHEISLDCRCCCCCFRVWAIATFVFDAGHVCVCVLCYWWVCMCACFRVWTTDKQEHSNEFTQ